MARKARIEFEGAFYHVIIRGNQKQKIFKAPDDFLQYLEILSLYKERYGFLLYAYVLMSNHVHVLIEMQKTPLSKILQGINQSYTMYFNRKYKTVGHLFQGRYKAILCDRDEYLQSLVKYIHCNPVRAKITKTPAEYQWSSHRSYIQKTKVQDIVDTDQVLRIFSENKGTARRLYRAYMGDEAAIRKENIYSTVEQRILGDERFVDRVIKKSADKVSRKRRERQYTLEEVSGAVEELYGVSLEQIRRRSKSRELSVGKRLMSLVASEYGYKNKEIAEFIRKDPVVVTRHLKERAQSEEEIEKVIRLLKGKGTNVNS